MANVSVSFRLPEETKRSLQEYCRERGISMSEALASFVESAVHSPKNDSLQKYRNETQEETNARILSGIKQIENGEYTTHSLEEIRNMLYGNQM